MDDARRTAEETFRELMAPLLELADKYPNSTEVFIDGDEIEFVDAGKTRPFTFDQFPSLTPQTVQAAAMAAAVFAGVEFGPRPPALPDMSVKIPPDLRVTCVQPPASDVWHMAIRFLRSLKLTLNDYVKAGIMTSAQADEIRFCLLPTDKSRPRNIVVSGGTSSGKTTLLRAMIAELQMMLTERGERQRTWIIEDTPELKVPGAKHLQTTLNKSMADLVETVLRLTPKRIVVGEIRAAKPAIAALRAGNTGHDGILMTIHSNGAEDTPVRLLDLAREAQPTFSEGAVLSGIDVVVQIAGEGEDRRVTDIWHMPR